MLKRIIGIAVLLPCLAGGAMAEEKGLVAAAPQTATEAWLQLQREGGAASRHVQAATPAERERSLQRWLDSFEHPIPEFFDEEAGGKVKR